MLPRPMFTEEELDVARTLSQLPKLVREADRRAGVLRWGAKRKRTGPADDPPLPPPPPPVAAEEKKLSTSPVTPLSFAPSGGDDTDSRAPTRPAPSLKPRSRISKPLNQRVMEIREKVLKLSADNENLKRSVAETKSHYEALKASNSWLRGVQLKMEEEERQRRSRVDLLSVGPTSPAGPHYPHPAPGLSLGWRWGAAVPDLSAGAEEVRRSAMRAAASAQARKRRIEIQREKSGCYSYSSTTPNAAAALPSLAYKMPPRSR